MLIEKECFDLNGHEILLRGAEPEDAPLMVGYLKTVSGETKFLSKEADEVNITLEQEISFINKMKEIGRAHV